MMTYRERLSNPRWQRRRTEIMQRADFRCQSCGDDTQELHVHHTEYRREYRNPWDYPDNLLRCLCADCHAIAHLPKHKVLAFVAPDKAQRISNASETPDAAHALLKQIGDALSAATSGQEKLADIVRVDRARRELLVHIRDRQAALNRLVDSWSEQAEADGVLCFLDIRDAP